MRRAEAASLPSGRAHSKQAREGRSDLRLAPFIGAYISSGLSGFPPGSSGPPIPPGGVTILHEVVSFSVLTRRVTSDM